VLLLLDPAEAPALIAREEQRILVEACHLGIYAQLGYMSPVVELLRHVYWSPEQAAAIAQAIERWTAEQERSTP